MDFNNFQYKSVPEDLLAVDAAVNPHAFAEIYDLYFPRLYNYINFRVGNSHLTDDLISQVFEKVLLKIGTYKQYRGSFSAWVFTIAHNTVVDYFRKQKNEALVFLDGCHIEIPDGIEENFLDQELQANLYKALSKLEDREKNILALKFWSGLSNRKIAELTGLSESNVGVIIYRTLRRLRSVLSDLGVNSYE